MMTRLADNDTCMLDRVVLYTSSFCMCACRAGLAGKQTVSLRVSCEVIILPGLTSCHAWVEIKLTDHICEFTGASELGVYQLKISLESVQEVISWRTAAWIRREIESL